MEILYYQNHYIILLQRHVHCLIMFVTFLPCFFLKMQWELSGSILINCHVIFFVFHIQKPQKHAQRSLSFSYFCSQSGSSCDREAI